VCAVLWNSVLGECFSMLCGVRQGGVVSPVLFSVYIDNVIANLRNSGCGLHIGSVFVGCMLYADDILLVSCSCYRVQKMIDICAQYGVMWDIHVRFNANQTQCITFGGRNPPMSFRLGSVMLQWTDKCNYLGVSVCICTCYVDVQRAVRKFYGSINNILSVVGK